MIETNNLIACVDIAHTLEYINAKHKGDSEGIAISPDARTLADLKRKIADHYQN